jgi:UDP-galactopyranose mutase
MPLRSGSPRSAIDREEREREHVDYLIAGAGFAASVVAERLTRKFNKRVLICDRRPHIGENAYDH